jgi:hypothetical protein
MMKTTKDKSRKALYWITFFLFIGVFIAYLQVLDAQFLNLDDNVLILRNSSIQELTFHNVVNLFIAPQSDTYIPLVNFTFALEHFFFGFNPTSFHFFNILLHAINVLLLFWFTWELFHIEWLAFAFAGIFAFHPFHVESVAWVFERKDLLYALFYILSIRYYHCYSQSKQVKFYVFSFLFFVLSCLSKPMAISLPVILILYDYFYAKERSLKIVISKIPFFVLLGIVAIVAFRLMKFDANSILFIKDYNFFDKIVVCFYGIYLYFQKTLIPFGYCAIYNYPKKVHGLLPLQYYIGAVLSVVAIAFVFLSKRSNDVLKCGTLFFLVSIAPVIQLFPNTYTFIADRYSYLPTLGFVGIILALLYKKVNVEKRDFREVNIIIIGICLCLAIITYQRAKVWQNTLSLYSDVYTQQQATPSIFVQLGNEFQNCGDFSRALSIYQEGDLLFPNQLSIKLMVASTLAAMGRVDESIKAYEACLRLDPNFAPIYLNLSECYFKKGIISRSMELSLKAMSLDPQNPIYIYDVGYMYYAINEKQKGIEYIQRAAKYNFKPAIDFLLAKGAPIQ